MPLRILVVEDHARFRQLICAALQRRPEFQTIEAADGLEAVQKVEELQPDVILLDINMPKMHGFEVARRIRKLAPRARLLFLSQESSSDIVRKALSLGAHGYVQKVSAATDLLSAIDAVLAGQRFVSRSVAFTEPADAPAPRRHEMLFCPDDAAIVDGFARCVARRPQRRRRSDHPGDGVSPGTSAARRCARRAWTSTVPSSAAPAFPSMPTSHLTPSDFSRRSTACVRPPPMPGRHILASRSAGNVRDACGPQAERRRRSSSNNSVASWRMTSTSCACIRCRTRPTIRRSRTSARSTPPSMPARRERPVEAHRRSARRPVAARARHDGSRCRASLRPSEISTRALIVIGKPPGLTRVPAVR